MISKRGIQPFRSTGHISQASIRGDSIHWSQLLLLGEFIQGAKFSVSRQHNTTVVQQIDFLSCGTLLLDMEEEVIEQLDNSSPDVNIFVEKLSSGDIPPAPKKGSTKFVVEDNVGEAVHIHYRNLRLELTVDDFRKLANELSSAEEEIKWES